MILSKLELSVMDMKRLNIKDEYSIHQLVYSMFSGPDDEEMVRDFLYVKKHNYRKALSLLILSHRNPRTPDFCQIQCKKIPRSYLYGDEYFFTIKTNPVRRSVDNGRLFPVVEHTELLKWFSEKAHKAGMLVDPNRIDIQDRGIERVNKKEGEFIFNKVTFVGQCKVIDREAFIKTFENGFGRTRAFGFGLMELQPVSLM